MIPWYWTLVAYAAGQLIAVAAIALCAGGKEQEHKYIK